MWAQKLLLEPSGGDSCRQVKILAFLAVVISTVAIVGAVVLLPLQVHFVLGLQRELATEVDFCKVSRMFFPLTSIHHLIIVSFS